LEVKTGGGTPATTTNKEENPNMVYLFVGRWVTCPGSAPRREILLKEVVVAKVVERTRINPNSYKMKIENGL